MTDVKDVPPGAGAAGGAGPDPDAGYVRGLGSRQIQMIAIGGAIGTGLFLGAGRAIHQAGPSLIVMYAVAGAAVFVIMRALGELPSPAPSPTTPASSWARSPATPPAGRTG
jgi:AAT family amino acid transporter